MLRQPDVHIHCGYTVHNGAQRHLLRTVKYCAGETTQDKIDFLTGIGHTAAVMPREELGEFMATLHCPRHNTVRSTRPPIKKHIVCVGPESPIK